MVHLKRITAIILVCVLLAAGAVFGADAASIVSPAANSIVYTDSLLVSVKVTELKTIRVSVYEEKTGTAETLASVDVSKFTEEDLKAAADTKYSEVLLGEAALYTNTADIGFYTKQIAVTPGLYKVKAETLETVMEWSEEEQKLVEKTLVSQTVSSLVAVKTKPAEEEKTQVFQDTATGAVTFIRKILKGLFK